jgi:hypothetical protein
MATAGGKSIDWNGDVANDGMQSHCGSLAFSALVFSIRDVT